MFCESWPWDGIHKTTNELLTKIILVGLPYPSSDDAKMCGPFLLKAPKHKNYHKIIRSCFVNPGYETVFTIQLTNFLQLLFM
jgi:hypothetical protein